MQQRCRGHRSRQHEGGSIEIPLARFARSELSLQVLGASRRSSPLPWTLPTGGGDPCSAVQCGTNGSVVYHLLGIWLRRDTTPRAINGAAVALFVAIVGVTAPSMELDPPELAVAEAAARETALARVRPLEFARPALAQTGSAAPIA